MTQDLLEKRRQLAQGAVALPTKGDIRAQDLDAAEKAGCLIGGGSTAVVSISSPLLITR